MNNAAALLAAIREHPDEDTPRLEYADCIQEDGDEERAELIRIQCEVARTIYGTRCPICGWPYAKSRENGCIPNDCCYRPEGGEEKARVMLNRKNMGELRTRERDLLLRHPEWRPQCVACANPGHPLSGHSHCRVCGGSGRIGEYRRGWLHCVRVPRLVDVWERQDERCPKCRNTIQNAVPQGSPDFRRCATCKTVWEHHDWQPTPWALTLVREHPLLAEVVCEDRSPRQNSPWDVWWWEESDNCSTPSGIPSPVYREHLPKHFEKREGIWNFDSASDALSALAVAQVAALRRFSF